MADLRLREAYVKIIERLPILEERHAARLLSRRILGGDTDNMIKTVFEDIDELKWLLLNADMKSLVGLKMFIRYLDFLSCKADAWKLRMITKAIYPECTIKIDDDPDLVGVPIVAPPCIL